MRFIFEQVRVGGDRNFGDLLGDREAGVGLLIDPSFSPEVMVERASLQRPMKAWPEQTTIWPGHDCGARPSSTMGWEKRNNPFLLCADVEAFLEAKRA